MVVGPKLKIYAVVLGIFVLGAGAGGAAGYAVASKKLAEVLREDRPDLRRFEGLSAELDLTRPQRKQVREIIERHRDETRDQMRVMFEKCGEDVQSLRARVDGEIRGVLTAEQAARFKVLMEQRSKRFGGPGGGKRFRKGD